MIHSVFLAKALPSSRSVSKSTNKRENRRIMLIGGNTIYAGTENAQVEVGAVSPNRLGVSVVIRQAIEVNRTYHCGSISSRTKSSMGCRFRISANLSPRTIASAGNGREL